MQALPIDTAGMTFTLLEVVPVLDDKGRQAFDRDDVPQWRLRLVVQSDAEKPSIVEVKMPSRAEPMLPLMQPVTLVGLRARYWSQGDRSGVSFPRSSVTSAVKGQTNGTKVPPAPQPV